MTARRVSDGPAPNPIPTGSTEDQALTLAFQRGEEGAYQAIYSAHSDRVGALCRRMLSDPDDAEEASQETFLRVYQALIRFNGRYQLGAWIARIATNVCLDLLRSRARRPFQSTSAELLDLDASGPPDVTDPELLHIRGVEGRRVRRVLAKLPPLHRAAIVLREFEGFSYAEIAVALDITECQVKALLHRARKRFRRTWEAGAALIFLPGRVVTRALHRVRASDGNTEHVVQVAASNAPTLTVCGTAAVHQCGAFISERLGALGTAALVGVASVSVPAPPPDPPSAVEQQFEADQAVTQKTILASIPQTKQASRGTKTRKEPQPPSASPAPAPPASVAPSPSPSPSPTPTPSPTSSPPEKELASSGRVNPSIGFDRGDPITSAKPTEREAEIDCQGGSLRQRLVTTIDDGGEHYPAEVVIGADAAFSLELTVWKDGFEIGYSGGGSMVTRETRDGVIRMTYGGRYGTGNPYAASAGLPSSGSFTAELALDCRVPAVVSERVVLAT